MTNLSEKDSIISILTAKKDLLTRLLHIMNQQISYIDAEDIDALNQSVSERKQLIIKMLEYEAELKNNGLDNHPVYQSELTRVLHDDINELLKNIKELDAKSIKAAENKVDSFKNKIRDMKSDKNRYNYYKNLITRPDGIYIDKKK